MGSKVERAEDRGSGLGDARRRPLRLTREEPDRSTSKGLRAAWWQAGVAHPVQASPPPSSSPCWCVSAPVSPPPLKCQNHRRSASACLGASVTIRELRPGSPMNTQVAGGTELLWFSTGPPRPHEAQGQQSPAGRERPGGSRRLVAGRTGAGQECSSAAARGNGPGKTQEHPSFPRFPFGGDIPSLFSG